MVGFNPSSPARSAAWGIVAQCVQPAYTPVDSASGGIRERAKILIVEDDYFVALELEHRLDQAGYDVIGVASTADEAVSLAAAQKPELAIMDIRLAGERDGVDAAIELQEKFEIPSIFATAHGDRQTRLRGEEARPLGWLTKPYGPEALRILWRLLCLGFATSANERLGRHGKRIADRRRNSEYPLAVDAISLRYRILSPIWHACCRSALHERVGRGIRSREVPSVSL